MSTVSSAGSVIASGYLSSSDYNALSSTQQSVSNAEQNQLNNEASLVDSLYSGSSAPSLFTASTSSTNAAAAAGLSTQENSALTLVASNGGESGFPEGIVSQSALLESFLRNGLSGLLGGGSASADAASGQAAQASAQQTLIASLYAQANSTSPLTGTKLSGLA